MSENFKAPKVGDTVNHVSIGRQKITAAKVVTVHEGHEGRLVTLEVPGKSQNADGDDIIAAKNVTVPYRPKDKIAGNTWHFALLALLLLLSVKALANIPTYHNLSANGNTANPATGIFLADPNSQVRLVSVYYIADTNNAAIQVSSGTTAYTVLYTNAATTTVTNIINSTNGLSTGAILLLQHGVGYTNAVASWGNTGTNTMTLSGVTITNTGTTYGINGQGPVGTPATNVNYVVINSGGWGILPSMNDEIYLMGPISSFPCNGTTNIVQFLSSDAIFCGNYGRPLLLMLTPASKTNQILNANSHYDSASQP